MSSDIISVAFDYSLLGEHEAEFRKAAGDIRRNVTKNAIETGRILLVMKAKAPHGAFTPWVNAELGITVRTAQLMMNTAQMVEGKCESISLLPATTLYALAAPSTDPRVIEEVEATAKAGEPLEPEKIVERIAHYKAEKARQKEANLRSKMDPKKLKRLEKKERDQKAEQEKWRREREEADAAAEAIVTELMPHIPTAVMAKFQAKEEEFGFRNAFYSRILSAMSQKVNDHIPVPNPEVVAFVNWLKANVPEDDVPKVKRWLLTEDLKKAAAFLAEQRQKASVSDDVAEVLTTALAA